MSQWSQSLSVGIIIYPVRADVSTIAGLSLLVSTLSWEFCKMSLWPVNSAFFVTTISGTSLFPSFVNLPLGQRSLKHVKP